MRATREATQRLYELAGDIGRLRRRTGPDWTASYIVDRIANHTESVIAMLEPTAAELVAWTYPGDDDAVDEAIRIVEARGRRLRKLLDGRSTA